MEEHQKTDHGMHEAEQPQEPLIKTVMSSTLEGDSFMTKIRRFFLECKRVLHVTRKPTNEEFKVIVKVSGIGILLIGAIGFIIHLFKQLIF